MCSGYIMAVGKDHESVTRKRNLGHYYFHIAGLFRGQNYPVDQLTAPALLKYG